MRKMFWLIVGVITAVLGFGTALTANKDVQRKEGMIQSHPVEDDVHIYKGAMVCVNAAGYAVPAADTAGYRLLGEAYEECDNTLSGHSQGGKDIRVRRPGVMLVVCTSITQAMVGQMMYIKDDQTVDDVSTQMIPAGVLIDYISATAGWIDLGSAVAHIYPIGRLPFVTKDDDYTVKVEESGTVFAIATDAKAFTLPATEMGLVFAFVNTGADGNNIITISPAAADAIMYVTSVDDKDLINTKSTSVEGDMVVLMGDGGQGWIVLAIQGTWAKEG